MPNFKKHLSLLATTAYLAAAFMITAATSTSRPGEGGGSPLFGGDTNYAVASDCPNRPDVLALHVKMGTIEEVMTSSGQIGPAKNVDFRGFGFPRARAIVGLNQYAQDSNSKEMCVVRDKWARPNATYDATDNKTYFIQPGSLTTVVYDCTISAGQCTTILEELPASDFRALTAPQKPAAR